MKKSEIVIEELIKLGKLSKEGVFEITSGLVDDYFYTYKRVIGSENKFQKKKKILFARKLAAMFLLEELKKRSTTINSIKKTNLINEISGGFVYIISNLAFPDWYKIGITKDMKSRLNSYQTYDPLKRYKIEHYVFCPDSRNQEKIILENFGIDIVRGEWINIDSALKIFNKIHSI